MTGIEGLTDRMRQVLERASTLELIILGAAVFFTLLALQARRRRRRRAASGKYANRRPARPGDDGGVGSSKENDLFNEAFGDDFSDTGGAGTDGDGGD